MANRRPYQFKVLKTFKARVAGCENHYFEGQTYTVRIPPLYNELDEKVSQWLEEGLVQLL